MTDTNAADQKQAPRRGRPRLTHCHRGHDLSDPANLHWLPNGQRQCLLCRRIICNENYYDRKRRR